MIPPETQEKFGSIIELIKASESMNMEERQYWINILPIMTSEQMKSLTDILQSEKDQLAAIDKKYASVTAGATGALAMEEKIRSRKAERLKREEEEAQKEGNSEEMILSQIQAL